MALGMDLLQMFIITYSKRLHTYSRSGSPEHAKISRGVSEVSSTGNNFSIARSHEPAWVSKKGNQIKTLRCLSVLLSLQA